jgi:hypothetical protein
MENVSGAVILMGQWGNAIIAVSGVVLGAISFAAIAWHQYGVGVEDGRAKEREAWSTRTALMRDMAAALEKQVLGKPLDNAILTTLRKRALESIDACVTLPGRWELDNR